MHMRALLLLLLITQIESRGYRTNQNAGNLLDLLYSDNALDEGKRERDVYSKSKEVKSNGDDKGSGANIDSSSDYKHAGNKHDNNGQYSQTESVKSGVMQDGRSNAVYVNTGYEKKSENVKNTAPVAEKTIQVTHVVDQSGCVYQVKNRQGKTIDQSNGGLSQQFGNQREDSFAQNGISRDANIRDQYSRDQNNARYVEHSYLDNDDRSRDVKLYRDNDNIRRDNKYYDKTDKHEYHDVKERKYCDNCNAREAGHDRYDVNADYDDNKEYRAVRRVEGNVSDNRANRIDSNQSLRHSVSDVDAKTLDARGSNDTVIAIKEMDKKLSKALEVIAAKGSSVVSDANKIVDSVKTISAEHAVSLEAASDSLLRKEIDQKISKTLDEIKNVTQKITDIERKAETTAKNMIIKELEDKVKLLTEEKNRFDMMRAHGGLSGLNSTQAQVASAPGPQTSNVFHVHLNAPNAIVATDDSKTDGVVTSGNALNHAGQVSSASHAGQYSKTESGKSTKKSADSDGLKQEDSDSEDSINVNVYDAYYEDMDFTQDEVDVSRFQEMLEDGDVDEEEVYSVIVEQNDVYNEIRGAIDAVNIVGNDINITRKAYAGMMESIINERDIAAGDIPEYIANVNKTITQTDMHWHLLDRKWIKIKSRTEIDVETKTVTIRLLKNRTKIYMTGTIGSVVITVAGTLAYMFAKKYKWIK